MNKKARAGLISLVTGGLLALSVQHVGTGKLDHADERKLQATWKQKNDNRKMARSFARIGYGWSGQQWHCLNALWTGESRFDQYADNPNSTAYGIAQLIGERSSIVQFQLLRGLRYISVRYGTPCKAHRYHQRHGWY